MKLLLTSLNPYRKHIFFAYTLLITLLSLWPTDGIPAFPNFPNADKIIHACMYAGFTFLMLWAWPNYFYGYRQFLPFLAVVGYGFFMETLQRISILGRSYDLRDELANSLGFFPGWLFWKIVIALQKRFVDQEEEGRV